MLLFQALIYILRAVANDNFTLGISDLVEYKAWVMLQTGQQCVFVAADTFYQILHCGRDYRIPRYGVPFLPPLPSGCARDQRPVSSLHIRL